MVLLLDTILRHLHDLIDDHGTSELSLNGHVFQLSFLAHQPHHGVNPTVKRTNL